MPELKPLPLRRTPRWWWLALAAILLALLFFTPFGGWLQSFFTGVHGQDVYAALDTAEARLPRDPRERERLLAITAKTDGEAPIGLEFGPRLHPAGTLARLRYETFDENGAPIDDWRVRALVPTLGAGPFFREDLEFFPDAIIPIPRRFVKSRWVQVDGCGKPLPFPPPPAEKPVGAIAKRDIPDPPDLRAIVVRRDAGTGYVDLKVDEAWLREHPEPIKFGVATVCRYDPSARQWESLQPPDPDRNWRLAPLSLADAASGERVAFEVPRETALFWIRWFEDREGNRSARMTRWRDALAVSGPILCNDLDLGPVPEGRVAACVPFRDQAQARLVPRPDIACN